MSFFFFASTFLQKSPFFPVLRKGWRGSAQLNNINTSAMNFSTFLCPTKRKSKLTQPDREQVLWLALKIKMLTEDFESTVVEKIVSGANFLKDIGQDLFEIWQGEKQRTQNVLNGCHKRVVLNGQNITFF